MVALILNIGTGAALAAPPVVIIPGTSSYPLGLNLDILEDRKGTYSLEDVLTPRISRHFAPSTARVPSFGVTDSAYWLRFTVAFPPEKSGGGEQWVVQYRWPVTASVTAYIPQPDGTYRTIETGACRPPSSRDVADRFFFFRLPPQPGTSATVYIRIRHFRVLIAPLVLVSESVMKWQTVVESITYGIFFGMMIVMLLYHLLLFAGARDRRYLFYALYIASQLLFQAVNDGTLGLLGWAPGERLLSTASILFLTLGCVLMYLYLAYVLDMKRTAPRGKRAGDGLIILMVAWCVASFLVPPRTTWYVVFILLTCLSLTLFCITVLRLRQGYRPALFILAALAFLFSSDLINWLIRFNLIMPNWYTEHTWSVSAAAQSVIIALMMARQIRQLGRETIAAKDEAIRNLERSERLKDELIANTSHELRTPLHGIIGLSESLLAGTAGTLSRKASNSLALIVSNGKRLLALVNDILDFSSIKNRDIELIMKPLDVHSAVALALSLLSPLVKGRSVFLRNLVSRDTPRILADEERFKQVLMNLIGNAIKFTPSGHVDIAAVAATHTGTRMVAISVADTGIGIPHEDRERVFNSFEQVEKGPTRTHGGVGLGLAITKKIVELHGGEIRLESVEGKGSTFTVIFPCAEILAGEDVPPSASHGMEELPVIPGAPSILVADDDPVCARILTEYLAMRGCETRVAVDGAGALDLLERDTGIDLVLLDVMMPRLSGFDVLRRIRQTRAPEELPVIMITAKTQVADIEAGFEAGANDYILKPFHLGDLSNRIENALRGKLGGYDREPGFTVSEKGKRTFFPYSEIIYFSSRGRKTIVHTTSRDVEISMQFKDVERRLPEIFTRIHRQYIVNTNYIMHLASADGGRYVVKLRDEDDTTLAAGRAYIENIRDRMLDS